jgi:hypothetical protein
MAYAPVTIKISCRLPLRSRLMFALISAARRLQWPISLAWAWSIVLESGMWIRIDRGPWEWMPLYFVPDYFERQ